MTQRAPVDGQLRAMAEHIRYEYDMLVAAAIHHGDSVREGNAARAQIMRNVSLESLAIHFRNLQEFFCFGPSDRDDARAFHYAAGWTPPDDVTQGFTRHRDAVNRRVGHLSYSRVAVPTYVWFPGEMLETAAKAWDAFLAALPSERRAWFQTDGRGVSLST